MVIATFYIQKKYSYGREPYWRFYHYGYCWSIDNFFQDEENIKKYQKHFDKHKKKLERMKKEKLISSSADLIIREFPKRQTEKKFHEYLLHHFIAVSLILFSIMSNQMVAGAMILLVHDMSDILMAGCRGFLETKFENKKYKVVSWENYF